MLKHRSRLSLCQLFAKSSVVLPLVLRAATVLLVSLAALMASATLAFADCRFSSTAFPTYTPFIIDPSGLALNGGAFTHHGNVMAAGRVDNLIFFHFGSEIIPEISNIVNAKLNFDKQVATFHFGDASLIQVSLVGVTTIPHSQQNVPALYSTADGHRQKFYLLCD